MQSEIQLQAKIFQTIWNQYPETRRCLFSVPNGGTRNLVEATQLKASGLVAGEPDLILVWSCKVYGFEVKTETGTLSLSQKEVHKAWKTQGIDVYIIRSVDDGIQLISDIIQGNPVSLYSRLLSVA